MQATDGALDQGELQWDRSFALGVVMAAQGYPEAPLKGAVIKGLPAAADDLVVFHAGTAWDGRRVSVSGGRVLCVTALGVTIKAAQQRAYEALAHIQFEGAQFRRDIGYRALLRK
jgi:phosphoribosylamine--glycine ligase